jgi:glycosyltransferase involved in cell wall biosynthesis
MTAAAPEICLLVEGTYPYVAGGVSSWIHDLIRGLGDRTFAVVNIGSHPAVQTEARYELPLNLLGLHRLYCQDGAAAPLSGPARAALDREIRLAQRYADRRRGGTRVLQAIRRLHLEDEVDDDLLADLAAGDLDVATFLHGRASFDLLAEVGERLAPSVSFLDLFWHFRAMHVPLLRLLAARAPRASCYHAVSTGYAGVLGAVWGRVTGRPFVVTEHGIYARERDMELARAEWIRDQQGADLALWAPVPSTLRRLWSGLFRKMARLAYHGAARIVTLSEVNRQKQLADGAPPGKTWIVPNGVELGDGGGSDDGDDGAGEEIVPLPRRGQPLRVGFVGRVVPIKDVTTFIRACDLALRRVPLDVRIIGPDDEDPSYAARCKALVTMLGRQDRIRFLGPQPPSAIYGDLDVVVLTSFSEGQPLVILEGYASSVPAVATDVGACREMIEGRTVEDRRFGPSGIVTRVAIPEDTAAALVRLAENPHLRRRLGAVGRRRVVAFYQRREMLGAYRSLYRDLVA